MYIIVYKNSRILMFSACYDTVELARASYSTKRQEEQGEIIPITHVTEETGKEEFDTGNHILPNKNY